MNLFNILLVCWLVLEIIATIHSVGEPRELQSKTTAILVFIINSFIIAGIFIWNRN